jgi:hypothetical protein
MPEITLDPKPPLHGKPCLLCAIGATMPMDVRITYGDGSTETVHLVKFCAYFTPAVPKGVGYTCHDLSGQCPDVSGIIG